MSQLYILTHDMLVPEGASNEEGSCFCQWGLVEMLHTARHASVNLLYNHETRKLMIERSPLQSSRWLFEPIIWILTGFVAL